MQIAGLKTLIWENRRVSSFFIKRLLQETVYRILVNSSDRFVPELI